MNNDELIEDLEALAEEWRRINIDGEFCSAAGELETLLDQHKNE